MYMNGIKLQGAHNTSTATKNGNNSSVAVQLSKGNILKGITLICKKNKIHG